MPILHIYDSKLYILLVITYLFLYYCYIYVYIPIYVYYTKKKCCQGFLIIQILITKTRLRPVLINCMYAERK